MWTRTRDLGLGQPATASDPRSHVTEIIGTSDDSVDAAINDGVARALGPAQRVEWVEITGISSNVLGGTHRYRVALRVGLRAAA